MDFGIENLDLDDLILSERNKLWIDKNKLSAGSGKDDVSADVSFAPIVKRSDSNCSHIPGIEDSSACLGKDQRKNYSPKQISSPTFSSEPRMRAMVRHGEYSPLNPNFLSPGKFMLGLGEYEERRRLLMLQKKQEYKEYLSQVRLLVHSRNGNPSPTYQNQSEANLKPHSPYYNEEYSELTNNNNELPNTLDHQQVLDAVSTTPTHSSIGVQTPFSSMGGFLDEPASPRRSQYAENPARLDLRTPDGDSLAPNQAGTLNSQLVSTENLSPRERKLADLQVSQQLSKMFFETSQETNPAQIPTNNFQARRHSHSEIYKEELRQQIEAKRKLDNELKEKEKREEEAINRRVEAQQEKLRQEYLKEEAKRLEMQKQRLTELEENPDRQAKCSRNSRSSHETALPRQMTSNGEVYSQEQILQGQPILSEASGQAVSQLKQDLRQSINPGENPPPTVRTEPKVNCAVQLPPALPFRSKSFTVIDSTISDDASFIKPPVDTDSNRLWKPTDRNMQVKGCKTCNFEDSLPIPLFRTKSPTNLPVDTLGTETLAKNRMPSNNKNNNVKPTTSQAMKKLEAKWQVPAVEKNNITRTVRQGPDGGRQKNVLTQLGAFRQQLQLEQMQTQGYKTVKPHRTKMK